MRKINKGNAPDVLVSNEATWLAELASAVTKDERDRILGRYKHGDVKSALELETSKKCVYCESNPGVVSYEHIEHIKPKTLHPTLAFNWENLTLACEKCNISKGKLDPTTENFVNPYTDDPDSRFSFYGPLMCAGLADPAAELTIIKLDLNRADLWVQRVKAASEIEAVYKQAAHMPAGIRREYVDASIRNMISDEKEYIRTKKAAILYFETEYADIF